MAAETVLDLPFHRLSVLYEDIVHGGVGRILQQEILLNRLDVSQEGLPQDFDAMEFDDGFELQDDLIDRSGDIEPARSDA